METPTQIHKIYLSPEAIFDYQEDMELGRVPKLDIKYELEEYIRNFRKSGRINELCRYFRVKYYDETSDTMLMLFVYRAEKVASMQLWKVSGMCREEDWNEDLEYDGSIRNWLKAELYTKYKTDWVLELREEKRRDEFDLIPTYSPNGLSCEEINAVYNGTDKEISKKLSHLQRKGRRWYSDDNPRKRYKSLRDMYRMS